MKISDQIGLAVTNLSRRKGRTALTVVGVVVGICAVIVMISMGIAESHNNDEMLKNMGGLTKIEVYNYGSQNINGQEVKLDNEAVQRFRKIDHVTAVTPYYQPDLNLYVEAGKNKPSSVTSRAAAPVNSGMGRGFPLWPGIWSRTGPWAEKARMAS